MFFKLKLSYSVWPSEMGIIIELFWCSSTDVMWQRCLVSLTSSGISSSHFHWHRSLLYVIQFKPLNQKFYCPVSLVKRCRRECNIQLICGYIYKKTQIAMLWFCLETAQWSVSVYPVIVYETPMLCFVSAIVCPSGQMWHS